MSYWCFFLEFPLIFLKTLTFTLNLYLMFHWLSSFHKRKSFSLTFSLFRWFIFSIPHSSSYLLFLSPEFLKKIIFSHFLEWLSWFFHSFSHFLSLSLSSDELLSEREGGRGAQWRRRGSHTGQPAKGSNFWDRRMKLSGMTFVTINYL